jgi:hypothetical protein
MADLRSAIELLIKDRLLAMETLVRIETKERELVPLRLNQIQLDMHKTSSGRDIYLKPAQVGASTYHICDFLLDSLFNPGTTSVIISYDEFITGRLLRKAHIIYNDLKRRFPTIPKYEHKSTYEMTFPEVNGSFYIGSARSSAVGRGETIHNLLLDEYAFWQKGDAERLFASALQRVPLHTNTKIRILSTPNGIENDYYETYQAALEGNEIGKSVYKAHTYYWFMHPEYRLSADNPFVLPGDDKLSIEMLTEDEQRLVNNFNLDLDQIRWRRYKMAEMDSLSRSGASRLLFGQEYPEDNVSCFLTAGDMVYNPDIVNNMAKDCYPAPIVQGDFYIWYPPEAGHRYVIGVDPGMAKESKSVSLVFEEVWDDEKNEKVLRHCASYSGLILPQRHAEGTMELGKYYSEATIAAEANIEFLSHVTKYPNLYYREDPVTGKVSNQLGWLTTTKTKKYLVSEMIRNLHRIQTHDINLVSQLRNIRWVEGSGDRFMSIGADDFHDAAGIAIVCRTSIPVYRGIVGTTGWSW